MKKSRPILVACVSDVHAGGTTALCPDKIVLDDGGEYHASKAQRWLMQCWRDYWARVEERRAELKAELLVRNLRAADGEDCHGLWLEGERKIQIRAEDDRTVQWMTLWHEWTHAILWHAGVVLSKPQEERVCDAMGAALAAMLLADPPI